MQDDLSPISRMMNGGGGVDEVSGPVENTGVLMSQPPGHITAPMRAWTRSRSLTFGFYEWPPFADSFRFFSKRSGVVMGTEVLMPASQLELPALAKSTDGDPQYAAARYIEFTMEGLKPNSRYTLKVTPESRVNKKTARSTIHTISDEEMSKRDNFMRRLVGVMVSVNGGDGVVSQFDAASGMFQLHSVTMDGLARPTLMRFESEYTANGLPARCYTRSTVYFSRWGAELRASSTLAATEVQDKGLAASVTAATSRAAREYELKTAKIKSEMRDVRHKMADEQKAADSERRLWTRLFLGTLASLLLLGASLALWAWLDRRTALRRAGARIDSLGDQLAAARQNCSAFLNLTADATSLLADRRTAAASAAGISTPGATPVEPLLQPPLAGGARQSPVASAASLLDATGADAPTGQRQQGGGVGEGLGGLDSHLKMLTDLYQNQVLLKMQRFLDRHPEPEERAPAGARGRGEL
eukprot:jgi/Tetstr1/435701/TSEL_024600.t1